jgi:hypothetical protein
MSVMPLRRKRGKCFPTGASKPERCFRCGHSAYFHKHGRCLYSFTDDDFSRFSCNCPAYVTPKGEP